MMRHIKKVLIIIIAILSFGVIFIVNGVVERITIDKELNDFKDRAVFVIERGNTRYYEVKAEYDYEDTSRHIKDSISDIQIGATGDIYVTSRNPVPGSVFLGFVSKLTWIGHAGLVIDDKGRETIEIVGNVNRESNVVKAYENTWIEGGKYTDQIAVLRIKDTTEKQRDMMVEYAESKIGMPYNYTFLFNRKNSFYCSDLVSRAVAHAGININYDHLATTGSDMIVSENTYLIYYRERISDNRFAVYYLTEGDHNA